MSEGDRLEAPQLDPKLQELSRTIRELAENQRGDSLALLALLRMLESLHQEIRDGLFQESLPDNRQALYNLLRDIEAEGGWPYIYRMKLQTLLAKLPFLEDGNGVPLLPNSSPANKQSET
jgi:hypothetical protein